MEENRTIDRRTGSSEFDPMRTFHQTDILLLLIALALALISKGDVPVRKRWITGTPRVGDWTKCRTKSWRDLPIPVVLVTAHR